MKFPTACKITEAIDTSETARTYTRQPYLDVANKRLLASDGKILVSLEVEPAEGDVSGPVPTYLIEPAQTDARYLKNKTTEVNCSSVNPDLGANADAIKAVLPSYRKGDPGTITFGVNVDFLVTLARALGANKAPHRSVEITIQIPDVKGRVPKDLNVQIGRTCFHPAESPIVVQTGDPARANDVGALALVRVR